MSANTTTTYFNPGDKSESKSLESPQEYIPLKTQSNSIKELATALAKAQASIRKPEKSGVNTFFKNAKGEFHTYSTLGDNWDACREPLSTNGLSVVQTFGENFNGPVIITKLLHNSGEWMSGECPLLNPKGDMQGLASASTYARRYSLDAMCGISSEDDDANTADHGTPNNPQDGFLKNTKPTVQQPIKTARLNQHKDYTDPPPFEPNIDWTNKKR